MKGRIWYWLSVGLIIITGAGATGVSAREALIRPVVVIRTYNYLGVNQADLAAAQATAAEILGVTGVELRWLECEVPDLPVETASTPCERPLNGFEFVLRVVGSLDVRGGYVPLGTSVIDHRIHAGFMSTVYPARVARVAAGAGVDRQRLLGRAIAHELGHLLMARTTHSSGGIMRAGWSAEELKRDSPADWLFSDADRAEIQARVHSR